MRPSTDMLLRMDVLQRQPLFKRPVPANGLLYAQAIDAIDVRAVDLLGYFDPQLLAHAIPWDSVRTYRRCQPRHVAHVLSWDARPTLGRFQ